MLKRHLFLAFAASLTTLTGAVRASDAAVFPPADLAEQKLNLTNRPNLYASGVVEVQVEGKTTELATTIEKIVVSQEQIDKTDERAREMLRGMNGKVVNTAVIHFIGGRLLVSLNASGPYPKGEAVAKLENPTAVKIEFQLAPDNLTLHDGARSLTYQAPGQRSREAGKTEDFDLKVDSISKRPDGGVALKGSFSGRLTKNTTRDDLAKPIEIQGTFDITRASLPEGAAKFFEKK